MKKQIEESESDEESWNQLDGDLCLLLQPSLDRAMLVRQRWGTSFTSTEDEMEK